ncbi:AfsR/SARP family transcriptional regulator [Cellulomonas triticagri]|uniref:Bacterial transcriptional activator domain-containing protein n=1 Tax=Cellulomonas triticagri TaxID=2483352 RepID=A0A3M2JHP9_9CELL|nr:BTAD domain-containing putative transcriptional regulator [Cellulomonas triticagri]RMI13342.1 hypothetical protein EBM89_04890 [Cellulomonas triticagri]
MPETASEPLRLAVLGPVRAAGADDVLLPVAGRGANLLLALALEPRGLSAARALDETWPDGAPSSGRAALQTLVSRLRAAHHAGLVVSTATGYALGVAPDAVDLHRAAALADRARQALATGDPSAAADGAAAALTLWSGEPGDGVTADALVATLVSRSEALRRDLLRVRAAALVDLDDGRAVDAAEDLLAVAPLDDGAHLLRMRALHAGGRTTEAVAAFAAYRERLRDTLGTDPAPDVAAFHLRLLSGEPAAAPAAAPPAGPEASTTHVLGLRAAPDDLIGRDADLAAVDALLGSARVVTVLGTGGLGKTRLVQEVARRAADRYAAVVVAELASVRDDPDVLPALAAALRVPEPTPRRGVPDPRLRPLRDRVLDRLGDRPTLLVLDNCEQVLDGVGSWVADVVAASPGVQVLVTSRAPLAVPGERVHPLAPLATHAPDGGPGPAVRLFVERATAVRPDAALPEDVVARLCTRLDGLPLAIELAAARVRSLTVVELERRLTDRFALLVGGSAGVPERHRTLRAVIDWSWDLLTERQRRLCRRVAVLPAGVPLGAALRVSALDAPDGVVDETAVLDDLDALVAQSLLRVQEDAGTGAVRYRMLETVREFGRSELRAAGEEAAVRAAVLDWAAEVATDLVHRSGSPERIMLDPAAAAEHDNLVAVLRSALDHEPDASGAVLALYGVVALRWMMQGAHDEVGEVAPRVLALAEAHDPVGDPAAVVLAVALMAGTDLLFGDRRAGVRGRLLLRRVVAGAPPLDPVPRLLADLVESFGDLADAGGALARGRASTDVPTRRLALFMSWSVAENGGDLDHAYRFAADAHRLAVADADPWTRMMAAAALAGICSQGLRTTEALGWVAEGEAALVEVRRLPGGEPLDLAFGDNIEQTRGLALLTAGRWDEAEAVFRRVEASARDARDGALLGGIGAAEARRGRGEVDAALAAERDLVARLGPVPEQDPWLLIVAGTCLAAHALADRTDEPLLADLAGALAEAAAGDPPFGTPFTDRPVLGTLVVGVGAWWAATAPDDPAGLELLALGERLGSRQDLPAVSRAQHWERATARSGERAVAAARAAVADLPRGADVARAITLVRRLTT